ncbi:TRAP transporter small permease [Candidatus Atribacteria bacterium 1244-E10-H5-B2]|nr:MAG: TRAP transporter small permease [Candidatus Atribacteria bacterium 1244-E10-H5-B2]
MAFLSFCMITMLVQILFRYVFNIGVDWLMELVRYSGAIFALLALPNLIKRQANIKMDMFKDRVEKNVFLTIIIDIFLLFCLSILFFKGIDLTKFGMKQLTPALQVPKGYLYIFTPVSAFLSIIQLFNRWIIKFTKSRNVIIKKESNFGIY